MKKSATILLTATLGFAAAGLVLAQSSEKKSVTKPAEKKDDRAAKGDAVKGKAVFEEQCAICHFPASNEKKIGPGLKAIYRTGKFANGKKVDDASMRSWIENGGVDMPAFKESLTAQQIADLLAYLRTL